MNNKLNLNTEILKDLYINQNLSAKEIAQHYNCGKTTIIRHLKKHGIVKNKTAIENSRLRNLKKKRKSQRNGQYLTCPICEKEFYLRKALINKAETHCCSTKCNRRYQLKKKPPQKRGKYVKCETCGKIIYRQPETLKQKHYFCSLKCFRKSDSSYKKGKNSPLFKSEVRKCKTCGKEILRTPSSIKKNVNCYCSRKCMTIDYQKNRDRWIGENNPNWKDGTKIYYGPNWRKVSDKIIERDNHECCRCHMKESELPKSWKLQVHHIIPLRKFKDFKEANRPENLITLCSRCHGIVEAHGIDF